jgi:hypothetical protein
MENERIAEKLRNPEGYYAKWIQSKTVDRNGWWWRWRWQDRFASSIYTVYIYLLTLLTLVNLPVHHSAKSCRS